VSTTNTNFSEYNAYCPSCFKRHTYGNAKSNEVHRVTCAGCLGFSERKDLYNGRKTKHQDGPKGSAKV